ncbi:MAG: HEAT repeat domain-containing protein [Desulfobacteraceae bacterium]|nr:HEAT repeat domain-containing protein [Desulfobacteraceae bacterium]
MSDKKHLVAQLEKNLKSLYSTYNTVYPVSVVVFENSIHPSRPHLPQKAPLFRMLSEESRRIGDTIEQNMDSLRRIPDSSPNWLARISDISNAVSEIADKLNRINVEILVAYLEGSDDEGRRSAAVALRVGKIDTRAVEPLIAALKDRHVKKEAVKSLRKITGQDFGQNQAKWKQWWNKNKGIDDKTNTREEGENWEKNLRLRTASARKNKWWQFWKK